MDVANLLAGRMGDVVRSRAATGMALVVNVTDPRAVLNGPDGADFRQDMQAARLRGDGWEASMLTARELVTLFRTTGEEDNAALVESLAAKGGLVVVSGDSTNNDVYITRIVQMGTGGSA